MRTDSVSYTHLTIFIGKVTGAAVFVGNVADRFDSYSVSGVFGGLENIVFLLYFAIEGILHMDQKEMIMVGINFHINLSAGGRCFYTCLDGIFQQIGKHKAQIEMCIRDRCKVSVIVINSIFLYYSDIWLKMEGDLKMDILKGKRYDIMNVLWERCV